MKTINKCPKCGCSAYTSQGTDWSKLKGEPEKIERQRRKCKYCGCKYTVNPIDRQNPVCPYCQSSKTRKNGFSKNKLRKYRCVNCDKNFQTEYEGGTLHRLSEHQKKMSVLYVKQGYPIRTTARAFQMGATTLKRLLDKHPKVAQ